MARKYNIPGQLSLFDEAGNIIIFPGFITKAQKESKSHFVMDSISNESEDNKVNPDAKKKVSERMQLVINAYEKAQSGKEADKQAYMLLILNEMEKLIIKLIKDSNSTYSAEFDDLLQEAREIIIEKLPEYNPYNAAISTFFSPHVKGALRIYRLKNIPISNHYLKRKNELDEIVQKAGFESIMDSRLNIATISAMTGKKPLVIRKIIEFNNVHYGSIEEMMENHPEDEFIAESLNTCYDYLPPETAFLKKETDNEKTKTLNDLLSILTPLEKDLFLKRFATTQVDRHGRMKPVSLRNIRKALESDNAFKAKHNLDKTPTLKDLSYNYQRISLKFMDKCNAISRNKSCINGTTYEQADINDIIRSFSA